MAILAGTIPVRIYRNLLTHNRPNFGDARPQWLFLCPRLVSTHSDRWHPAPWSRCTSRYFR